jgi:acetyl-CoA acetyltransferase
LRFIGNAGIKDASIVNAFGGALAMGYMPGAAGLHALTMLVHGLQSRQIGLCFQFGDGWSAGVLVKRMP